MGIERIDFNGNRKYEAYRKLMTNINTLIIDIQSLLTRKDGWFTDELAADFAQSVASRLQEQFADRERKPTLRLSQMGPRCPRALWYSIHHPELAEKMPPWVENKFSFGHITEAWAITLMKAAGHEVTGEQDELRVDGIVGHRDCVVDGCLLDVKSSSSRAFDRFKEGTLALDDPFGYLDQLDGYLSGSLEDPLVRVKDKAYILAIDKQLGHMVLYEHVFRQQRIKNRISTFREIVARDVPPACECGTVPHGKSGNIRLDTKASYNGYKHCCFPNLRTFIYEKGPVYLTVVIDKPKVLEVDKHGQIIQ